MPQFQPHFERLELKFLIDELEADRIRAQIAPYCRADSHGGGEYPISSLYLDTPALAFHEAKERGDPNRLKLRIRTYSSRSPATLEIKRRCSDVIAKTRMTIDRAEIEAAARGVCRVESPSGFLDDFARVVAKSGAQPTLTVRYRREAYESVVDDYARITFDRRIETRPTPDWDLCPDEFGWCSIDDHWKTDHVTTPVVMEVKCQATSLPLWVLDLIRDNTLRQSSFSKYSIGIHLTRWLQGARTPRSRAAQALS